MVEILYLAQLQAQVAVEGHLIHQVVELQVVLGVVLRQMVAFLLVVRVILLQYLLLREIKVGIFFKLAQIMAVAVVVGRLLLELTEAGQMEEMEGQVQHHQ